MITVGGRLANRSSLVSPPRSDQLIIDDLDDTCWAGFNAPESSAAGSLLDRGNEVLTTDRFTSASRSATRISRAAAIDVGVGQPALATQVLERRGEAVLQGVEHERPYVGYWTDSAY